MKIVKMLATVERADDKRYIEIRIDAETFSSTLGRRKHCSFNQYLADDMQSNYDQIFESVKENLRREMAKAEMLNVI